MWKFSYSCCGYYWRGETIQGKKLFAEILYLNFTLTHLFLIRGKLPYPLSIWKNSAGSDPVPSLLFSVMSDIGLPDFGGQDLTFLIRWVKMALTLLYLKKFRRSWPCTFFLIFSDGRYWTAWFWRSRRFTFWKWKHILKKKHILKMKAQPNTHFENESIFLEKWLILNLKWPHATGNL